MERPWGLSGPEFLELYWIALAVSLVVAIGVRVRLRGTRGVAPAGALGPAELGPSELGRFELGRYELAFLIGGPRRVVETSTAALIDSGALRPARDGAVRVVGTPVSADPVDQAVLTDAARYRYRTLPLLFTAVSGQDAPRAVGDRLVARGYLVSPWVAKRWLRRSVVPMALVAAVGVVRWVNGLAIGAPVGWLTLQLVLTGVLIALLRKASPLTRTALGSRAVATARAGGSPGGGVVAGPAGDAGLVALNGFAAHPNIPLRAAARRPVRRRFRHADAGGGTTFLAAGAVGSSCGSGGSSCGSGGSSCGGGGGGGGGGCGGGGGGG
ncbi:TIGR04222 domain-containing membrane protein [Actinosynnema sp. CS-041913]|uniref:TIGR04222 domain-containing membrane protein n=1 Tax=Actinosynnema sp. CS-041913 TaxID=3239917 RepID=UPI003D90723E